MIWTHNVYKGYQQTTLADRELKVRYHLNMLYKAFILGNSMISTHNVHKGYQQTTLADRELKVRYHLNMLYKAFIYLEIL